MTWVLTKARENKLMIFERHYRVRALKWVSVALIAIGFTTPTIAQVIPTPESVLGFPVGADFELANYEQALEYFQKLADASDRVELQRVGETSYGKPWYLAVISSGSNLKDLEHYREISQTLAYPPDDMTREDARKLAM